MKREIIVCIAKVVQSVLVNERDIVYGLFYRTYAAGELNCSLYITHIQYHFLIVVSIGKNVK